jgi:hypothetical protein
VKFGDGAFDVVEHDLRDTGAPTGKLGTEVDKPSSALRLQPRPMSPIVGFGIWRSRDED